MEILLPASAMRKAPERRKMVAGKAEPGCPLRSRREKPMQGSTVDAINRVREQLGNLMVRDNSQDRCKDCHKARNQHVDSYSPGTTCWRFKQSEYDEEVDAEMQQAKEQLDLHLLLLTLDSRDRFVLPRLLEEARQGRGHSPFACR